MSETDDSEARGQLDADVVIVGAGPCGTTIANLLGVYGVRTILLDREPEILDYPRAVGMDDEALRSFQTVDLAEPLLKNMVQNVPARYHHSSGRMFAQISPQGQPFGWPRRNIFLQPLAEKTIRDGLSRFPHVDFRQGVEATDCSHDDDGVTLNVIVGGQQQTLRARYLVGADGGRSTIRRLVGITLEGKTHEWRWLVIDVRNDDRFLPFSGIYCDPSRPHMVVDLPYGHRRYEFRLKREESDEEMSGMEAVSRLLAPHFPAGARPDIVRSRIYTHHSRIADRFAQGRVFIAGDAAHLQPPFFGQGMNSGLRDATNLAWKLHAVIAGKATRALLASYEQERRDHALAMVNFATWIGSFYAPKNKVTEFFRALFFRLVQSLPNLRDYVLQMKFKPLPRYTSGLVVHDGPITKASVVGRMFMQPRVETLDGRALRLDDAIGNWFAIIGINEDPNAHMDDATRRFWRDQGARVVMVNRSRRGPDLYSAHPDTLVLDDVAGAFRDWKLARPDEEIIVLRPDRYVAATSKAKDLGPVLDRLRQMLSPLGKG
ncbi:MAG: bifunctional 3-(3-hydroxy-phenyl)propionate/3-hydroxycinnamic acid hydroxylase [Alphaproteobacteria bacterium]|nr:bifunctional 3-(3-hydroxy-phenyl)propionate/3-hydroxycinnamic acid hydroxylase [Alphaproteobacteria bacterium]